MVLGLARTGREAARFLVDQGAEVVVSDCRGEKELHSEIQSLAGMPIHYLLGGEESEWVKGIETLVPSPGVPSNNPLLQEAAGHGVEIISEIELAYGFLRCPTGCNYWDQRKKHHHHSYWRGIEECGHQSVCGG